MMRTLLYLILTIFGITLLRMVIGIVVKMAGGALGGGAQSSQRRTQGGPTPQAVPPSILRKCPACGTYTPESSAVVVSGNGDKLFFCSDRCRQEGPKSGVAS